MSLDNPNVNGVNNVFYTGIPITLDSTREEPYIQYPLMRQGESVLASKAEGASLPAKYSVDTTGPVISVSFTPVDSSIRGVTPSDFFAYGIKPMISAFPDDAGVFSEFLNWDSEDSEVSAWDTTVSLGRRSIDLNVGEQVIVTTKPLPAQLLKRLTAGTAFFSLMPGQYNSRFEGFKLRILSVAYKLKLTEVVV